MPKTASKTSRGQDISAFNSYRRYSEHGQRIAYCVLSNGCIAMSDIDRNIDYMFNAPMTFDYNAAGELVEMPEVLTDRLVLQIYDQGRDAPWSDDIAVEYYEVTRELQRAAAQAPSLQGK